MTRAGSTGHNDACVEITAETPSDKRTVMPRVARADAQGAKATSVVPTANLDHLVTVIRSPALNIATSPYSFVGQSASGFANSDRRSDKYG